jgi:hypothetical protein
MQFHQIFFIQSFSDGHLDCFCIILYEQWCNEQHLLDILTSISISLYIYIYIYKYSELELLGYMVAIPFLDFWGTSILCFIMAIPICNFTNWQCTKVPFSSYSCQYLLFFDYCIYWRKCSFPLYVNVIFVKCQLTTAYWPCLFYYTGLCYSFYVPTMLFLLLYLWTQVIWCLWLYSFCWLLFWPFGVL